MAVPMAEMSVQRRDHKTAVARAVLMAEGKALMMAQPLADALADYWVEWMVG